MRLAHADSDDPPEWIQLFPRGPELETVPGDGRSWRMSDPEGVAAASMAVGLDLVLDWEHAQIRSVPEGRRSDAAGWITEMAVRDGLVMGRVNWTDDGWESVRSRKYRYVSPYFFAEGGSGEVRAVQHVSLVNSPAFVMPALAGREENDMDKRILAALALAAGSGVEAVVEAIKSLRSERDDARAAAAAPPLADYAPRADYDAMKARAEAAEADLATLREAEIDRELDAAEAAGRITPAQRGYHRERCLQEGGLKAFKEYVGTVEEIAGSAPRPAAAGRGAGGGSGSPEEDRITRMFGRDRKFLDKHAPRRA